MNGALDIEVRPDGNELVLELEGDLDIATAGTLRACLESIDGSVGRVTLDLSRLRFLDSTGIGVIVEAHRRLDPQGRELVLRSPQGPVAKIIDITGLRTVLKVEDQPLGV